MKYLNTLTFKEPWALTIIANCTWPSKFLEEAKQWESLKREAYPTLVWLPPTLRVIGQKGAQEHLIITEFLEGLKVGSVNIHTLKLITYLPGRLLFQNSPTMLVPSSVLLYFWKPQSLNEKVSQAK